MKKAYIALLAFIVIILIGVLGYLAYRGGRRQNVQVQPDQTANWKTVKNDELGFSLKYPSGFFDTGHEPKILIGNCNDDVYPDQCPDIRGVLAQDEDVAGNYANSSAPVRLTINGTPYCLSKVGDAAAGHQYYYDYYVTVKNQKCLVVELGTATTTCENYLPLESGNTDQEKNYNACIAQRENRPKILEQITGTLTFNEVK